jgi:hypothetical protein
VTCPFSRPLSLARSSTSSITLLNRRRQAHRWIFAGNAWHTSLGRQWRPASLLQYGTSLLGGDREIPKTVLAVVLPPKAARKSNPSGGNNQTRIKFGVSSSLDGVITLGQRRRSRGRLTIDETGPIVRIAPEQLHIKDSDFYDEIYAHPPRKLDKEYYSAKTVGAPSSAFGTIGHNHHRLRRSALN